MTQEEEANALFKTAGRVTFRLEDQRGTLRELCRMQHEALDEVRQAWTIDSLSAEAKRKVKKCLALWPEEATNVE